MDEVYDGVYVSSIEQAEAADKEKFNTVVSVCQGCIEVPDSVDYKWIKLADGVYSEILSGGDFSYFTFAKAVNAILESEKPMLVHCYGGISRSTSTVTTAIAYEEEMEWDEVLEIVKSNHPKTKPIQDLRNFGKSYLEVLRDNGY